MLAVPEIPLARRPSPSLRHLAGVRLITYAQMREVHWIENRLGRPERGTDRLQVPRQRHHPRAGRRGRRRRHHLLAVVDRHRPGLRLKRLAKVSPRIVGIACTRDRYRIPAADAVRQADPAGRRLEASARLGSSSAAARAGAGHRGSVLGLPRRVPVAGAIDGELGDRPRRPMSARNNLAAASSAALASQRSSNSKTNPDGVGSNRHRGTVPCPGSAGQPQRDAVPDTAGLQPPGRHGEVAEHVGGE